MEEGVILDLSEKRDGGVWEATQPKGTVEDTSPSVVKPDKDSEYIPTEDDPEKSHVRPEGYSQPPSDGSQKTKNCGTFFWLLIFAAIVALAIAIPLTLIDDHDSDDLPPEPINVDFEVGFPGD